MTENNEPIVHSNVGVTELRIDQPLPPKANEPPKPAAQPVAKAAEQPKPPVEKRLTRLEKLRLEAKQRAEGTAGGE